MDTGKSLTERVADEIVRTIIGKELNPGDKLPNEFELAFPPEHFSCPR